MFAADTAEIKAKTRKVAMEEFQKGREQEKLRAWFKAISHYKSALLLVPGYFWAHKQIGYCYYVTGNYDSAVSAYERYLEANPKDNQTRYFLHDLRKKMVSGELNKKLAPEKTGREIKATPYLGLAAGGLLAGDSDAQAKYAGTWGSVSASSLLPLGNLEGGYLFANGFYGQVTLVQGIVRSIRLSSPKDAASLGTEVSESYRQSAMLVTAGWAFRLGENAMTGFHVGAGPTAIEGPGGASGDSFAWTMEGRWDWLLGKQWGAGLRLGWFSATFSDFTLEHSGFSARAALQWFLFPIRE